LHVWSLLYAWAEVLLLNGEHFTDWFDLTELEQLLDFRFIRQVLILKVKVVPGVIRLQRVGSLFVLDPRVVHERVFEKLLEVTSVLYYLGFGSGIIDSKGDLEACLSGTLPEILTIFLCFCMVKLTEAPQTQVLLTSWRLILIINGRKEALNFSALVSDDEATKTVFHDVLVGHVQFVDDLSAMWSELLSRG